MRITHIYHSGFVVELESCNLLFDWYTGKLPALSADVPLAVFVSHEHSDHYNPAIWGLRKRFSEVHYVVDEDVAAKAPKGVDLVSVVPHQSYEVTLAKVPETIRISTLESNDEGVAFLVEACNKTLFFSGDLNVWWWDRPQDLNDASDKFFRGELARIADKKVDVAFVPLDPRLVDPAAGIIAYMEVVGARALFPMHYADNKTSAHACLTDPRLKPYASYIHFEDVCEFGKCRSGYVSNPV
ncbi:MAG: MBL fold metallo-hydrolase [Atopobiaceae bacterium]|jgi:L-ascorbate metabolism protein UlaG (beta-lactamase superfamily)|nr:MBL fold metallo-hydrolase [Atopobiaceae bacterium]NLH91087.1 MBL fold metallo-hydrolase [Atopobium sp.]